MDKEPVEFLEFTVPFRDVDKHGKMFSAVYVHRAEEALATFWARRPASDDDPHFTVGKVTCTFHAALHQGDVVRMDVHVSKIGGKSAGFLVRMMRGKEEVAETEIVWTACDREKKEPVALPEELRDWLYQFLD